MAAKSNTKATSDNEGKAATLMALRMSVIKNKFTKWECDKITFDVKNNVAFKILINIRSKKIKNYFSNMIRVP